MEKTKSVARATLGLILVAVVVADTRQFMLLIEPIVHSPEHYVAGVVFAALALCVAFRSNATVAHKVANEVLGLTALVSVDFRFTCSSPSWLADVSASVGCGWHGFLWFVSARPFEAWCQFIVVLVVGRILVWAADRMSRDSW